MLKFIQNFSKRLIELYFNQYLRNLEINIDDLTAPEEGMYPVIYWVNLSKKDQFNEEQLLHGNTVAASLLISNKLKNNMVSYLYNCKLNYNVQFRGYLKFNRYLNHFKSITFNTSNPNEKWRNYDLLKVPNRMVIKTLKFNKLIFNQTIAQTVRPIPNVITFNYTRVICELVGYMLIGLIMGSLYNILDSLDNEDLVSMYNENDLLLICSQIRELLKSNDLSEEERRALKELLKKLLKILAFLLSVLIIVVLLYINKEKLIDFICFILNESNENEGSNNMKNFSQKISQAEETKRNLKEDFLGQIWQIQAQIQKESLIGDIND